MSKRDIKAKRWLRKRLNRHYGDQWEWSRAQEHGKPVGRLVAIVDVIDSGVFVGGEHG